MRVCQKYDLKLLAALKNRLAAGSKKEKCSTLCECIKTEIRTKIIPVGIKREICRQMDELRHLVKTHKWMGTKLTPDLIELFEVIENVKFNHDGYVRVQYAKFRNKVDSVKDSLVPPSSFELPRSFPVKLATLRMGKAPNEFQNLDCLNNRNWEQYLMQRSSYIRRDPIQHYRGSGIRIFSSVYDVLEIPKLAAQVNLLSKSIRTVRSLSNMRLIRTKIGTIDSALDKLELILKTDALCAINCKKMLPCLLELSKLVPNEAYDARVLALICQLTACATQFLKMYKGFIRINDIEEDQLRNKIDSMEMTADDVMIQKNEHFFQLA